MVQIIWTDIAIEDLKSIHEYISKDSQFYAKRFTEKILKRVSQLKNFPRIGRVVPELKLEEVRELIEGNYRIIYNINEIEIAIIRVISSAKLLI